MSQNDDNSEFETNATVFDSSLFEDPPASTPQAVAPPAAAVQPGGPPAEILLDDDLPIVGGLAIQPLNSGAPGAPPPAAPSPSAPSAPDAPGDPLEAALSSLDDEVFATKATVIGPAPAGQDAGVLDRVAPTAAGASPGDPAAPGGAPAPAAAQPPDAHAAAPFEIPGYTLQGELGRGGMAIVYLAHHHQTNRHVALKVMSPDLPANEQFLARFDREAALLARLNHPNIVSLYDRGTHEDRCYYTMEYIAGHSLRSVLDGVGGPVAPEWVLNIMLQVCVALFIVHDEGLVHRDIKPENILLDEEGRVKVTDFGLAGFLEQEEGQNLTRTNITMGTLNYMPPEQALDAARADNRADIFSFAVVLYEMLTGTLPKGSWKPPSQVVPGLDERFDRLVERCLAQKPADRPTSIEEVMVTLRAIQLGLQAGPEPVVSSAPAEPQGPDEAQLAMQRLAAEAARDEAARKAREEEEANQGLLESAAKRSGQWLSAFKGLLEVIGLTPKALAVGVAGGVFLYLGGFKALFPKQRREAPVQHTDIREDLAEPEEDRLEAAREAPVEEIEEPVERLYSADVMGETTSALRDAEALPDTDQDELDPDDRRAVRKALASKNPADVLKALELGKEGKIRYKPSYLKKLYARQDDPRVQRAIIDLIADRGGKDGALALGALVQKKDGATGFLIARARQAGIDLAVPEPVRQGLLVDAALAREASPTGLNAIRNLAALGGEEAETLLLKLQGDRSPALARIAKESWDLRVRLGLVPGRAAVPAAQP